MAIKMTEFLAKAAEIEIPYAGETVQVVYRINALSDEFFERYYGPNAEAVEHKLNAQLMELVVDWNLEDDEGEKIPVSMEVLRLLPVGLKEQIGRTILEQVHNAGLGADEKKA